MDCKKSATALFSAVWSISQPIADGTLEIAYIRNHEAIQKVFQLWLFLMFQWVNLLNSKITEEAQSIDIN